MSEAAPPRRPVYRLYIDEVGHASLKTGKNEEDRYLSLIGVACHLDHIRTTIQPQMEHLKRYFVRETQTGWQDPDEKPVATPIIFHRKEMATRNYPFDALQDSSIRQSFDSELLQYLEEWQYTVFSVVVDKDALQTKYLSPAHPYHYAMEILLERYVRWLETKDSLGDMMAEARGGKEDQLLKSHYQHLYEQGTDFVAASKIALRLSSRELKVKLKKENIAGLQLAEFLVRPCYYAALARHKSIPLPSNFGGKIEAIVEKTKYCRDKRGIITGFGRKWLP